jgi:hypothetical protein
MQCPPPSPRESIKARVDRTSLVDFRRRSESIIDWNIRCIAGDRLVKSQISKRAIVRVGRAWKNALSVDLARTTRKAIVLNEYFERKAMAMQDLGHRLCNS